MAKIGEGHAAAMGRLGLAELRNAMNPSRESVATTDMGLYGALTPGEIADARRDEPGKDSLDGLRAEAKDAAQDRAGQDQSRGLEL